MEKPFHKGQGRDRPLVYGVRMTFVIGTFLRSQSLSELWIASPTGGGPI